MKGFIQRDQRSDGMGEEAAAPLSRALQNDFRAVASLFPETQQFRLVSPQKAVHAYHELLFLHHCIIRASVPLMRMALQRCNRRRDALYAAYLNTHIQEELHHDEWLVQDLRNAGGSSRELLRRSPPASIAKFVGMQYYWVEHFDKLALLGYIAALESHPPTAKSLDRLSTYSGLEAAAFRTLRVHANIDPTHVDELNRTLDSLEMSTEQASLIRSNAIETVLRARLVLSYWAESSFPSEPIQ